MINKNIDLEDIILYLATIGLSGGLCYYNIYLGAAGLTIGLFCFWWEEQQTHSAQRVLKNTIEGIDKEINASNQERLFRMPIAMVAIDQSGRILWFNKYFRSSFEFEPDEAIYEKKLDEKLALDLDKLKDSKEMNFEFAERSYSLVANPFVSNKQKVTLIHFYDITQQKIREERFIKNEVVFCYIALDNYTDIIEQLPIQERSMAVSQIDVQLNAWAQSMDAYLQGYANDRYLMAFERYKLKDLQEERFSILDRIREMELYEKMQMTLSIGIGVSDQEKTIHEKEEMSRAALDLALARGGDQAIVRYDDMRYYYGGKKEATEKRTKVKARVKAHSLRELILESDNVLIMGHRNSDMDCIGSAIGLLSACDKLAINAKYILPGLNYGIRSLFDYLAENERYDDSFIAPDEVPEYIKGKTLLIIVDTQNEHIMEMPELAEQIKRMVIIDHHRRSNDIINKTIMNYTEVYASSSCELVVELLQYFDEKGIIGEVEANALMAGIYMDTKMFTFKTGVRTFEAASYLKRKGADMVVAKVMLQDDLNTYTMRSDLVKNATVFFDKIAISSMSSQTDYANIVAAQAADELLDIKGVQASFILVQKKGEIAISGRSMGIINVQVILEKMGGGGHLTIAGAQIQDKTLAETKARLLETIEDYLKENEE